MKKINWKNNYTDLQIKYIELKQKNVLLEQIIDDNEKDREYIFERGDIVMDLAKKSPKLILGTKDGSYEFMELKNQYIKDIFNKTTVIEKGSISTQPADIVEKHYSSYELI